MQVAVKRATNTIELRKVAIYRDFGTIVEVRDGLGGGERLVLSPPADLCNGGKVKIEDDGKQSPQQQAPASGGSPDAAWQAPDKPKPG